MPGRVAPKVCPAGERCRYTFVVKRDAITMVLSIEPLGQSGPKKIDMGANGGKRHAAVGGGRACGSQLFT